MTKFVTLSTWRREGIHDVVRAAEILEQRKCGRNMGADITVFWKPGECYEIDRSAEEILRTPGYGVSVAYLFGTREDSLAGVRNVSR